MSPSPQRSGHECRAAHLWSLAAAVLALATAGPARAQATGVPEATAPKMAANVPVVRTEVPPNSEKAQNAHYVVLVSLDGFRYDYPRKWGAPYIQQLAVAGATAPEGMLPSYPSITFPNHVTLITGLLPEHHGIVGNTFLDPERNNERYSYKEAAALDGTWYGGTPLWSLAEQQGMRAASFFWPGSEAAIAGDRPAEYVHFNDKADDSKRLDQIIAWLSEPPAERPHFLTLYYSNVDHAGHDFGPDAPETRDAVHHVDELMGTLRQKLDATGLPVDLVIVADHGMVGTRGDWITLDHYADLSHFRTDGSLLYPNTEADAARAYSEFRAHPDPRFTAYRRADVPTVFRFNESEREGDPVIVANGPFAIRAHEPADNGRNREARPHAGEHGFDPQRMPEMKALFVANGPDIRPGTALPSFPNVDVYRFIAHLLGLTAVPNDGLLEPLKPALR